LTNGLLIAVLATPAAGASAQTTAANIWPVGTSKGGITGGSNFNCALNGGLSAFTTGKRTFIGLSGSFLPPDAISGYPDFGFGSSAELVFTSATGGKVKFDTYDTQLVIPQPPKPPEPSVTFTDYKTVVTANPPTLIVNFTITFGGVCNVHETAVFHQP
jgi:hypothetical protein